MALRLLHCADLHLGQRLFDQDRSSDEEHALDAIATIAEREAVDAVIVAGDIFDTANPGSQEVRRYHRWLGRLVFDIGVGTVVVTAGNHDNALRIEAPRELLQACRIHVVGSWTLADAVDKVLVPITTADGSEVAVCAAVPYLRDGDVRAITAGERHDDAVAAHRQALIARFSAIHDAHRSSQGSSGSALPLIVSAHAFVTGGRESDSERRIQVGNLAHVEAADLAGEAAYLALGHLHRPHAVGGREHWRYCGSLLPTGFDEIDHQRSVVIADIPDHGAASVRTVPLPAHRRYLQIQDTLASAEARIAAIARPTDDEPEPWLKVVLSDDELPVGCQNRLGELAIARGCRLLDLRREQARPTTAASALFESGESGEQAPLAVDHILRDPEEVFTRLLADRDIDPDGAQGQELTGAFRQLQEHLDDLLGEVP